MSNISQPDELMTYSALEELLTNTHMMTTGQYLLALRQIQKSAVILAAMQMMKMQFKGILNMLSVVERVHYLIDSTEPKARAENIMDGSNTLDTVGYLVSDDDAALARMFKTDDPSDLPS